MGGAKASKLSTAELKKELRLRGEFNTYEDPEKFPELILTEYEKKASRLKESKIKTIITSMKYGFLDEIILEL
jgi:hypothetical protein